MHQFRKTEQSDQKFKSLKSLKASNEVMQGQIGEGIVERITESEKSVYIQKCEKVFYLPKKSVICEFAESTKLRIVYDASAKASKSTVSLN